ncbi:MAG TPA: DUF4825 domain-containing protein [Clostridiales bacterium]|nr:DUF4825 domain-containing protein [Clostridiales bacterium]
MELLQDIFLQIFNMGITASYVILALLLIRLCIKRAPKVFSYTLWAVAGFRLVCPISFSSVVSIFNLTSAKNGTGGTLNYVSSNAGNITSNNAAITYAVNTINKQTQYIPIPATSLSPMQILLSAAALLWIAGMILIFTYSIISYYRLSRRINNSVRLKDNIYESDAIPSPFVMGIRKPRIYIPFHMEEPELSYVLLHEKHHIRRFDYLVKPSSFLLAIVYWYNPLVWLAYLCMCKDMEMSCDEKVIKDMGVAVKKDYSMSLLAFATNHRLPRVSPLAFGEISIKSRIKNILNYKKTKLWITIVITIICLVTVATCIANPAVKSVQPDTKKGAAAVDDSGASELAGQLYAAKNPYIGNPSANGKLLGILGIWEQLGNFTLELETSEKPYVLRMNFDHEVYDRDNFDNGMIRYATLLLALIGNADEIQWSYTYTEAGEPVLITVYWDSRNLKVLGIDDIKSYGESAPKVQELIDFMDNRGFRTALASAFNVTDNGDGSPQDGNYLIMNDLLEQRDWGSLALKDWKAYDNAIMEEPESEGVLNAYLIFNLAYGDEIYKLQVSYLKADQSIDLIYLTRPSDMETILLYSADPKYRVVTDIEGFLNTKVDMGQYLTYELPASMISSQYNASLGNDGGNLFLLNGEMPGEAKQSPVEWQVPIEWCAPGGVLLLPSDSASPYVSFENGKLVNGTLRNNHTITLGEPVILKELSEQAVLVKVQHDLYTIPELENAKKAGKPIPVQEQTSTMYEIYFAREDGRTAYCIFLNEKYFTYDEAMALVNSVRFTDQAFN